MSRSFHKQNKIKKLFFHYMIHVFITIKILVQIIDLFLVFITVMQKLFIIYYIMISSMIITLSLDAMFLCF